MRHSSLEASLAPSRLATPAASAGVFAGGGSGVLAVASAGLAPAPLSASGHFLTTTVLGSGAV